MAKQKVRMNFATELISNIKRQLIRCRIALILSLAGNAILAAAVCKLKKWGK